MFSRTSFLIAAFACIIAIASQWGAVYANPGIRPMLHAFDVEPSSAVITDSASLTPSAGVLDAAASSSSQPEASTTPTSDASQANGAFTNLPGFNAAVLIGAMAAVAQVM